VAMAHCMQLQNSAYCTGVKKRPHHDASVMSIQPMVLSS
jgi:hypothetical protein